MPKNPNKSDEQNTPDPDETKEETVVEPELTEEAIEKEQEEIALLEDAMAVEPESLSEDQKEIIRRNKDKIAPEQQEYYKNILGTSNGDADADELAQKLEAEKKKSSASARENQKIYAKNRVINQALADAESIPEPTEEELSKEYSDWDLMSDSEKIIAKETLYSKKWRQVISNAKEQASKIEKWDGSVDEFADDPKTLIDNPDLEGKTDAFREFAKREENNSVPFKVLVGAFLHEQGKSNVHHSGKMFENGSGGPNTKPQPANDKLSLEDSRRLRETDYNKWKEYLAAGKIEADI